jgi:hypothetical protein
MDSSPLHHLTCRKGAEGKGLPDGFSLLEMTMVVTVIFEAISSQPSAFSKPFGGRPES